MINSVYAFPITGKVIDISPTEISISSDSATMIGGSTQPQDEITLKLGGKVTIPGTSKELYLEDIDNSGAVVVYVESAMGKLFPGESKILDDVKVYVVDSSYKEGWATFKVSVVVQPQDVPVCDKIGTKSEGWYLNDQLITYDTCICLAVCKGVGTNSEGYYSSCNGKLIQKVKCSSEEPIEVVIKGKSIKINQNDEEKVVEIISDEITTTSEKLRIEENKLSVLTTEGEKEIKYLPEEAKQKAVDNKKIDEVGKIEIIVEDEKPTYKITGTKKEYFLWIFPITEEKTILVDTGTNEFIE